MDGRVRFGWFQWLGWLDRFGLRRWGNGLDNCPLGVVGVGIAIAIAIGIGGWRVG